jgi:hypothetical protein
VQMRNPLDVSRSNSCPTRRPELSHPLDTLLILMHCTRGGTASVSAGMKISSRIVSTVMPLRPACEARPGPQFSGRETPSRRILWSSVVRFTPSCAAAPLGVAASPYQSLLTTSVEWQQLKLGLSVALDSDLSLCPRD